MKKTQTGLSPRKQRRTPRKTNRATVLPTGLPLGTQQALMGLAAYEARHQ